MPHIKWCKNTSSGSVYESIYEQYQKYILLIGTFHLVCAYMETIGKKLDGSGLADILLKSLAHFLWFSECSSIQTCTALP